MFGRIGPIHAFGSGARSRIRAAAREQDQRAPASARPTSASPARFGRRRGRLRLGDGRQILLQDAQVTESGNFALLAVLVERADDLVVDGDLHGQAGLGGSGTRGCGRLPEGAADRSARAPCRIGSCRRLFVRVIVPAIG